MKRLSCIFNNASFNSQNAEKDTWMTLPALEGQQLVQEAMAVLCLCPCGDQHRLFQGHQALFGIHGQHKTEYKDILVQQLLWFLCIDLNASQAST